MELSVFGNRLKYKRSELVEKFHLEGFPDDRIITIAHKELAADQRLAQAKEAVDQRLQPGSSEGQGGTPIDQSAEPHPDDADGLEPERPPQEQNQLDEEKLDEIVQRVQFGDWEDPPRVLSTDLTQMRCGYNAAPHASTSFPRGRRLRISP